MTVKELIETLKTCDEKSEVKYEVTYPDGYKS